MIALVTPAFAQDPEVTVGGYAETFWSWNFAQPENGVSALRGYDNRANTITLSNVALDATGTAGELSAHLVLQAGLTANTAYLAEPTEPAVGGAGPSDQVSWRNVQQALATWTPSDRLAFDAGLYLSPIGPESLAVKDDWNFSRSDLFYALPAYHSGVRAHLRPSDNVEVMAHLCNGWNDVVDNNDGKSVGVQLLTHGGPLSASIQYLGGPERPTDALEGQPWRHLGDVFVQLDPTGRVSLLVHANAGDERNQLGTNSWYAGAAYVRVQPLDPLHVTARGDWFSETATGGASPIFWPGAIDGVGRVASATLSAQWQPVDHLSLWLEGRHDAANASMFFDSSIRTDADGVSIPDLETQDTATIGAVAWF